MPNIKKPAGKRGPRKRKLAEEFPPGEVFTDLLKKKWKLGPVIGKGGFGCLYLADVNSSESVTSDAPYVIKVEPSDNGPLFTELNFYMRAAKPERIKKWISSHKLKYLGVPKYWGSGLHQKNGKSYRFMVMDRLGKDLQKIFEEQGKQFSHKTVLQLGLRILNVLEYIHEHEYVHGDIKASNLLLGHEIPNQVYLVDYGLAFRYSPEGNHKDYKENPKRCHDGTLEFTSIDAHKGVAPSRRGDLEILGYCMICWLSGSLPWEDNLQNPDYVKLSKIRYTDNISEFMLKCFTKEDKPDEIARYMEKVMALTYTDKPPYQELREIFLQGLQNIGHKDDGILDFEVSLNGDTPAKPKTKRKLVAASGTATADEDNAEIAVDGVKNTKKRKLASPRSADSPQPIHHSRLQPEATSSSSSSSSSNSSSHLQQDWSHQTQITEDLTQTQDKLETKEESSEVKKPRMSFLLALSSGSMVVFFFLILPYYSSTWLFPLLYLCLNIHLNLPCSASLKKFLNLICRMYCLV